MKLIHKLNVVGSAAAAVNPAGPIPKALLSRIEVCVCVRRVSVGRKIEIYRWETTSHIVLLTELNESDALARSVHIRAGTHSIEPVPERGLIRVVQPTDSDGFAPMSRH